jgi:hypothetical protein
MSHAMRAAAILKRAVRSKKNMMIAAAAGVSLLSAGVLPAAAQDAAPQASEKSLSLELNALQPSERGCRVTFLVSNELGHELSQVAFELALFTKAGMISRLTVVDFKELPIGKTKVRQYDLPKLDCNDVGRVLVNNTTQCVGDGIEADACIRELKTKTATEVTFGS